jgi:hypothetical protein
MQKVPYEIWSQYDAFLKAKVKDISRHENLKKWFLYFWDFCVKYRPPDSRSEQVRLFIEKLQNKKQSEANKEQAAHAVSLYFQMQAAQARPLTTPPGAPFVKKAYSAPVQEQTAPSQAAEPAAPLRNESSYNEWRCLEKSASPAWDKVISDLSDEIKTRHYSRKTLKAEILGSHLE